MVSGTSTDQTIDQSCQMEITTVDFTAHGLNLTSVERTNLADSVQMTTKDAIKRKLTARVSPMTRQTGVVYDPRVHSQVSVGEISHRSDDDFVKQKQGRNSATTASSSRHQNVKKRVTEKRKTPSTNVIIPTKSVNSDSLYSTKEEPSPKRHRTILPRTNLVQGKITRNSTENQMKITCTVLFQVFLVKLST